MSAPATALADPREQLLADPRAHFLDDPRVLNDPTVLPAHVWAQLPNAGNPYKTMDQVASGIAVGFLIWQRLVMGRMRINPYRGRLAEGAQAYFDSITAGRRETWNHMIVPAFRRAVQLGAEDLTPEEEQLFATMFANRLYDYLNETSADALMRSYDAQLAQKWNPDIAWARAVNGWGLDNQQTSRYLRALASGEGKRLIPAVAERLVARQLAARADRVGITESHHARQMGRTLVWMRQQRAGQLPPTARRRWVVNRNSACDQCRPMDGQQVGLEDQFTLPDGGRIWAPGVHPGCECEQLLVIPHGQLTKRTTNDPYNRNADGEFARVESRAVALAEPEVEAEPETQTVVEPEVRVPAAPTRVPTKQRVPVATRVPQAVRVPQATRTPTATKPATEVRVPTATRTPSPVRVPQKARTPQAVRTPSARVPGHGHGDGWEPYFLYANDLYHHRLDPRPHRGPEHWPDGDEALDELAVGDVLDFDASHRNRIRSGRGPEALIAEPAMNLRDMAFDAQWRYQAAGDFPSPLEEEHHQALEDLYSTATVAADDVVAEWDEDTLRELYREADLENQADGLPTANMRRYLIDDVQRGGPMSEVYLAAIERGSVSLRGSKTVQAALDNVEQLNDDLRERGVKQRVPTALIFAQGHRGGFIDSARPQHEDQEYDPDAVIEGKYRVARVEHRRTRLELGRDSPPGIAGMNLVYLVPEDEDYDGPIVWQA